jgi:hypothetical protein
MADNLTIFMCRLSRNSGSLNLLEPQGPVQACSGKALPYNDLNIVQDIKIRMGRSYNKNARKKDPKKGFEREIL